MSRNKIGYAETIVDAYLALTNPSNYAGVRLELVRAATAAVNSGGSVQIHHERTGPRLSIVVEGNHK